MLCNITLAGTPQHPDVRQDAFMPDRHRAPGGWTAQIIEPTGTPDRHDGQWMRVGRHGFWV
jgi:hypothetical protein